MAKKDPNTTLFAVGWAMVLVNLVLMAWAVYVPIAFYLYEKDILFSLDTAQGYVKLNTLSVIGVLAIAVLQVLFLGRLAKKMNSDTYQTAAAEAALKIARAVAVMLAFVSIGSLIVDTMYYRKWVDYYELFGYASEPSRNGLPVYHLQEGVNVRSAVRAEV